MVNILRNRAGSIRVPWKVAGFFALVTAAGLLLDGLLALASRLSGLAIEPDRVSDVVVVLGATAICLLLERRGLGSVGLDLSRRSGGEFALGGVAGGVMTLLAAGPLLVAQGLGARSAVDASQLLAAGLTMLGIAVFEELLVRGYVFIRLTEAIGPLRSTILVGLPFAAAHLLRRDLTWGVGLAAALNVFLASVLACASIHLTRRLSLAIGWHWCWNAMLGVVLGVPVSGFVVPSLLRREGLPVGALLGGGSFGPEAGLACTLALVGGLAALRRYGRRRPAGSGAERGHPAGEKPIDRQEA